MTELNLDYLINPSFRETNMLFFCNMKIMRLEQGNFILKVEIEHYNVLINGRNIFNQLVKIDIKSHDNFGKVKEIITQLFLY